MVNILLWRDIPTQWSSAQPETPSTPWTKVPKSTLPVGELHAPVGVPGRELTPLLCAGRLHVPTMGESLVSTSL